MKEYEETPTTDEVRSLFIKSKCTDWRYYGEFSVDPIEAGKDSAGFWFDYWVSQLKADAWDEGYSHCFDMERNGVDPVSKLDNPYRDEE